jgi:para-nitrobenzyl esterase
MGWQARGAALAAALTVGLAANAAAEPVRIAQGDVQGVTGGAVESFKGIPFAAPPVGDLRWRPPAAAPAWTGVKTANAFGAICMQPKRGPYGAMPMSEDCLTLNIWRPAAAKPGAKLPVMVWIYGGAFVQGASAAAFYDGTHFADQGVILVNFNYRLGRFGFFAHPALDGGPGPVGNYGLMDQIAALKWVKANIAAFGGDPGKVTVFGESAGAVSVNYLMVSPPARGLFARAMAESGFGRSAGRPLKGGDRSAEAFGQAWAEAQGIKGDDAAAATALRALSADTLNAAAAGLGNPGAPTPMIDGQIVTQSIAQGFAKGEEAHVPYLEGGNSYEASLFPRVADLPDPVIARAGDPAKVKALYGDAAAPQVARELITDTMITEPNRFLAREMAKQGLPVWVYHFSYVATALRPGSFGAAHGSEIPYAFANLRDEPITFGARTIPASTPEDHKIANAMHAYWVAFGKNGDPDSAGGPAWPRYTVAGDQLMQFGLEGVTVRTGFEKARLDLLEADQHRAGAP